MRNKICAVFIVLGTMIILTATKYPANAQDRTGLENEPQTNRSSIDESCETHPYSILVTIQDVRKSEGTITADLHDDDPEKFLAKGEWLDRIRVPAVEGHTLMCIPIQTPGVYAVVLYHDEDADKKFDKNFIGLPSEPFGLSRDPKIRLAIPKHKESAFEVNGPLTPVTVTLRH